MELFIFLLQAPGLYSVGNILRFLPGYLLLLLWILLIVNMIPLRKSLPLVFLCLITAILLARYELLGLLLAMSFLKASKKSSAPQPAFKAEGDDLQQLKTLQREKEALKKRILETPNTFYSQAHFFQSLLTLNELHFVQGFVEATAHFLHCHKVTYFEFLPNENRFEKKISFRQSTGLELTRGAFPKDRLLLLVKESRSVLSVREIVNNAPLHALWKESPTKALIYSPIFHGRQFFGVLTIDEIKFHHLNRETIKNVVALSRLIGLGFRNIQYHNHLIAEKQRIQSKVLTEYQQFLKSLNLEFKRATRNALPLSLIYIVIESINSAPVTENQELFTRIRSICEKNLREVDQIFEDQLPGRYWILLPVTDFNGLAFVLERLSLIINMELSARRDYLCFYGFSSLEKDIKLPKRMIEVCKESYQLHKTVRNLLTKKEQISQNES